MVKITKNYSWYDYVFSSMYINYVQIYINYVRSTLKQCCQLSPSVNKYYLWLFFQRWYYFSFQHCKKQCCSDAEFINTVENFAWGVSFLKINEWWKLVWNWIMMTSKICKKIWRKDWQVRRIILVFGRNTSMVDFVVNMQSGQTMRKINKQINLRYIRDGNTWIRLSVVVELPGNSKYIKRKRVVQK